MCFTQKVDDPFVVGSEQPYGVFEEQHEGRVYHTVGQLVRIGLGKKPKNTDGAGKRRYHRDFTPFFQENVENVQYL